MKKKSGTVKKVFTRIAAIIIAAIFVVIVRAVILTMF